MARCWHQSHDTRPNFEEVVGALEAIDNAVTSHECVLLFFSSSFQEFCPRFFLLPRPLQGVARWRSRACAERRAARCREKQKRKNHAMLSFNATEAAAWHQRGSGRSSWQSSNSRRGSLPQPASNASSCAPAPCLFLQWVAIASHYRERSSSTRQLPARRVRGRAGATCRRCRRPCLPTPHPPSPRASLPSSWTSPTSTPSAPRPTPLAPPTRACARATRRPTHTRARSRTTTRARCRTRTRCRMCSRASVRSATLQSVCLRASGRAGL